MIKIANQIIDPGTIAAQYRPGSTERRIIDILSSSEKVYVYDTPGQLKFELDLRKNIVTAAKELYESDLAFKVFRKSMCNPDYWHRTEEGGFLLESNVKPSDAIRDIYVHSSKYGTECATAIIIVYYKALLDTFPEELFDRLFPEIYLMNWQHLDSELGITQYNKPADYLPGDVRYFKNPDVDPLTPEWQGENVFDLGRGRYYGHGIGIGTADEIIDALNRHRESDSETSAYLLDLAKRLNFKGLAQVYGKFV